MPRLRLTDVQEQLIKICADHDIKLGDLINNVKWDESNADVFASSDASKYMYNQRKQLHRLHKLKGTFQTPIFSDDLFDKLHQNEFMQNLYANTRKGATRKDDRNTEDTSVDFSVNGGGDEKQPSTDQTQDLAVNNSGMKRAPKFINKFIKKAKFVKLEIGADQVDGKLDLVSFNRAGRLSDDGRKIHTSLLFAKWISDPEDADEVSSLMFFCCYSVALLNFCNYFFHSTFCRLKTMTQHVAGSLL